MRLGAWICGRLCALSPGLRPEPLPPPERKEKQPDAWGAARQPGSSLDASGGDGQGLMKPRRKGAVTDWYLESSVSVGWAHVSTSLILSSKIQLTLKTSRFRTSAPTCKVIRSDRRPLLTALTGAAWLHTLRTSG